MVFDQWSAFLPIQGKGKLILQNCMHYIDSDFDNIYTKAKEVFIYIS